MSALNLMTLIKRTSLNVYDADIFNCSQHDLFAHAGESDVDMRELT